MNQTWVDPNKCFVNVKVEIIFFILKAEGILLGKEQLPKNGGKSWKIAVHCTDFF